MTLSDGEEEMSETTERDYVLGTNDEEIQRLALQHRIWRGRALEAWRRAGFSVGKTILDLGCGPGHATMDLAEIVGPAGRVIAIDRSRRFLDFLEATRVRRGLDQIEAHERDLNADALPPMAADGAWVRWVFSFVEHRRELLQRVREALKPGGTFVIHEYLHYNTWRYSPRSPAIEKFVDYVETSWRNDGGEPNVGADLHRWLTEAGFEIRSAEPIIHVVRSDNYVWQWAVAFLTTAPERLVGLGHLTPADAEAIAREFVALEADPHAVLVTPSVLEIIAVRR